jgi:hypothetical protein
MKNVHGEDYAAAQNETTKSRHGTRPKREEAFLPDNSRCAMEAVLVFGPCFDGLHSCLDGVQRHGNISVGGSVSEDHGLDTDDIHCDDTSHAANTKGAQGTELLSWSNVTLSQLPQAGITTKPNSRVCCLPCGGGNKASEETTQALFVGN